VREGERVGTVSIDLDGKARGAMTLVIGGVCVCSFFCRYKTSSESFLLAPETL